MKYRLALILLPLIGISASAAEPIQLRAGPLSMAFDADDAFLRFVRIGKHEVLRGINAPVRNQFWETIQPEVSNLRLEDGGDRFTLTFDVSCRDRDIDFFWKGRIVGNAKGQVVFTFDGEARSTFMRNRIGFCILHGPSAAGKPWIIEDINGTETPGHFPAFISPYQPAKNIRAIAHEVAPDIWGHVRCDGDIFEMEDQRNWTDASFKTYCTPLELPYPVRVIKGTKISHKIEISLQGDVSRFSAQDDKHEENVTLTLVDGQQAVHPLPGIGLQLSSQVETLNDTELQRLKALNLDHLRVDITPSVDQLTQVLRRATAQANALGVTLHVGLNLGGHPAEELNRLVAAIESTRPPVSVWLVVSADRKKFQLARKHLGTYNTDALIGVCENNHFTELNRNRPEDANVQVVSYGLNPQCHAIDNLTMIETLEIQGDTVRSDRQFIGDRPLLIGPITLKYQKVNQVPLPGQLPSNVDARQPSLFTAGWTLGSVKNLSEARVHGLTYYETVGWKGIMACGSGSPLPQGFPSKPDEVYAVYHLLRDIGEFAGGQVREVHTTDTLSVVGLALMKEGRTRLMVANLTNRPQSLKIRGLNHGSATVDRLDGGNVTSAKSDPEAFSHRMGQQMTVTQQELDVPLPSHGIARIDQGS